MKKKLLWVGIAISALMVLLIAGLILFSQGGKEDGKSSEIASSEELSEVVLDADFLLGEADKSEPIKQNPEASKEPSQTSEPEETEPEKSEPEKFEKLPLYTQGLTFRRVNAKQIAISWKGVPDSAIKGYRLERSRVMDGQAIGEWITVAEVETTDGRMEQYVLTEKLDSAEPVQYAYRVMPEPADAKVYEAVEKESILASNVLICIDPGHFAGKAPLPEDVPYPYTEGEYTILIAKELKEILMEEYGIDSFLTREGPSITISGYMDDELDDKHLKLRGEYAGTKDTNLFLSLHTNSNGEDANGCPTFMQPTSITKTVVIANVPAQGSEKVIQIANAIGINLSRINYECGIADSKRFTEGSVGNIPTWTEEFNDGLNTPGGVVCRIKKGEDYYGVLRGAANVKVPGLIVEHGFHSVPEFRKLAMDSKLYEDWARADAYGIAYGYGFVTRKNMEE